ncbi:Trm112 family protein [Sphingomonas sp. IW22]|uniref:Trm112 family protein n=1 Tax=Sphingomonas sp. IW22 TaxID=3242489 RepID=UPI003520A0A0
MTDLIDPWLLERLVCPATRAPLRQVGDVLVTADGTIAYPIRDGVPVLLVEAGRRLSPDDRLAAPRSEDQ